MATDKRDLRPAVYTITNHNDDRALNCDSTSDGELADVLGSVILDLQRQGILKGTVA